MTIGRAGCWANARRRIAVHLGWAALALILAAPLVGTRPSLANGLDLGFLTNYAVVDLGSGTTFGWNVPVTGNMLLGNSVTANFAGGASLSGTLTTDSTVQGTGTFSHISPSPTMSSVSTTVTQADLATAQAVSTYAAGLTPNQTFTSPVSTATTLTGVAGLNVFDFNSIHNAALTISGPANATFVINVSGSYQTNVSMILSGGVTASDILFNFTGTSGQVLNTSGASCTDNGKTNGACLYGTFLATDGGQFQFSNLDLTGELINTAGNMQLVSGSVVNGTGFAVPGPTVGAGIPGLLLLGAGLLFWRRRGGQLRLTSQAVG
jgi:hypothetical protein